MSGVFELVGMALAFTLIVIMVNRRVPLGPALLGSSLLMGIVAHGLTPLGAWATITTMAKATVQRDTLELVAVVAEITVLARMMRDYNLLDTMVSSLSELLRSSKLTMAAVPGLVGCLPVLGGAFISAPMIDALGNKLDLSPQKKSAINLVFRHAWFFVFPFAPALIVASKVADVGIFDLVKVQLPLTAASLLFAYWFYFRGVNERPVATNGHTPGQALRTFLLNGGPLLFGLVLGVGIPIPGLHYTVRAPLYVALLLGIAFALFVSRGHPDFSFTILYRGIDLLLVLTMVGVMTFRAMVNSLSVVPLLIGQMVSTGFPVVGLFFVIPFLIGLITANQSTTVGVTFPLLLPMVPPGAGRVPYAMLAFVSSYAAYFLSPLHLCQVLTLQYFRTTLAKVYPLVVPVLLTMLATAFVTFSVIR